MVVILKFQTLINILAGCMDNNQITQLIIITIKDVLYQKRKKGENEYI